MNKKTLMIIIIEALLFLAIIGGLYGVMNNKLITAEQNILVYENEMEQIKLQNDNLLTYNNSYISTINDLEKKLNISKKEIKEIQNKLDSKIAYISKLESNINIDSITIIKDSIIYLSPTILTSDFCYNDKWLHINGNSTMNTETDNNIITINSINMNAPLTVGITNDYKIFVTTDNPYIVFDNIEGVIIDESILKPKKKLFSWGIQLGFGTLYDIIHNNIAVGPYGGVGVEFNF